MLQATPDPQSVDDQLAQAAETFGTPCYVFFTDHIQARIAHINAHLGAWFDLSYAMKCNPNPKLLGWLHGHLPYLDVSSGGELTQALDAGWHASQASFTGPGKRECEIRGAIANRVGELVVENLREAQTANRIAKELGLTQDILIRVSPDTVPKGFGDHMAGRPSPFGFDIETVNDVLPTILEFEHLKLIGLHIYSGTQCLKPRALCENYRIFMSVFRDLCERHDLRPQKLVFGSGLGVPYHDGDLPIDLAELAGGIRADIESFRAEPRFRNTKLILELGRYVVAEAGYFLTRVVTLKNSRGQKIGICDGGMNNHLPASGHFGMVIHRNYRMHRVGGGDPAEKVNLVGPLCTSIDRLANGVLLPELKEHDVIAVHNSGAYGLTASPIHFISHTTPREILIDGASMIDISNLP